ncbi:MAG: hypothetical protein JJU45_03515 [Acidimicrobiia bacterium]|nr:hypothetical protein [Acidimicrobiia bacterium]
MTQRMSSVESHFWPVGSERVRRKGDHALDRLHAVAGRGGSDATIVVALLESAADAAESHGAISALPSAELHQWRAVGATFDKRSRARNDERLVDAFGSLLGRSVIGDAAMAEVLAVDKSRVSQRVADRSLYAFTAGDERGFPRWQIFEGKALPGLKLVLRSLDPELHPLSVDHWFTTENLDLEIDGTPVSPATWLATGGDAHNAANLAADL